MSKPEFDHVPFYEIVERIKDRISHEVDGRVYDKHVAEALRLPLNSLRCYKAADYLPMHNLAFFCVEYDVNLHDLVFDK